MGTPIHVDKRELRWAEGFDELLTLIRLMLEYRSISPVKIRRSAERKFLLNPRVSTKTRFGFIMYLNPDDRGVSAVIGGLGFWEPKATYLFRSLLRDARLVVDVGANIGWYTLLSARSGAEVYSFEPEPFSYNLLTKSIRANWYSVHAFPYAIGDRNGFAALTLSDSDNKGTHSLVYSVGGEKLDVPVRTLDSVFPSNTIDLLKIDAEGSEPQVILGARELLKEKRIKHIILEWNPDVWQGKESLLEPFEIHSIDRRGKEHNLHLILR